MTLKIEHTAQTVNASAPASSEELLCCFDVSKSSLSLYAEHPPENQSGPSASSTCRVEESVPNQTGAIEQLLGRPTKQVSVSQSCPSLLRHRHNIELRIEVRFRSAPKAMAA